MEFIKSNPWILLVIYYGVMSVIAYFLYYSDKKKAEKGNWRTPEKTLLLMGFLGGSIGALLSMKVNRHKTKHIYFWIINIAGLVWQIALLAFIMVKF